jgi:hypothetical protein
MPSKNAQSASTNKNAGAKPPVQTFRLGRIKAAVWENEADRTKYYNVTFARTYMSEDKAYHDPDSFGRDDLPLVAKLADQAHTFIFARLAGQKGEAQDEWAPPIRRLVLTGRLFFVPGTERTRFLKIQRIAAADPRRPKQTATPGTFLKEADRLSRFRGDYECPFVP